jgi:hypothetical protein
LLKIERRFLYDTGNIENKLAEIGAVRKVNPSKPNQIRSDLTEHYFDHLDTYFLLFNNHVLCSKNENNSIKWQLSCPSNHQYSVEDEDLYYEVIKGDRVVDNILKLSRNYLSIEQIQPYLGLTIDGLVEHLSLKSFATIESIRESYVFNGISIDLDRTDFGFNMGQFKVIVDFRAKSDQQIEEIMASVADLTSMLGLLN